MMRRPAIHIIGAGFSGLSTAIHLSLARSGEIIVHERGALAGGKRRSFHDEALGVTIDSGAHLALASWATTLRTLEIVGARDQWREASALELDFADMASGERWKLRPNAGRIPWWTRFAGRRAPRTLAKDYHAFNKLRRAGAMATIADFAPGAGAAAERLWRPFALAALNVEPARASARLAGAILRETLAHGAGGARPLYPVHDFSRAFVAPALKYLRRAGVVVRFERNLRALGVSGERVYALEFEHDRIELGGADTVVLATPPQVAAELSPGLTTPREFSATLTAHFSAAPPPDAPRALIVVNGPFPQMFCYPDRICVDVRDAGALLDTPREKLAEEYWRAVAALTGLSDQMPAWRIVRQKRATFAATPAQDALRPPCATTQRNLFLAGAYVQNGLPENLESTLRSGETAARRVVESLSATDFV